jgi:hypothetical protein
MYLPDRIHKETPPNRQHENLKKSLFSNIQQASTKTLLQRSLLLKIQKPTKFELLLGPKYSNNER